MTEGLLASLGGSFSIWDWGVVIAYFAVTTYIGHRLAGKQATMRDFFLGGRKLPWYAVSGSIIATEISAVTFIGVPAGVYLAGGNFTYLQLGVFGTFFARIIVGFVLVPAYYRREIYSPYDYMGNKLGNVARSASTVLFSIGGVLAQSARVYLTALILQVVMSDELEWLASATGVSSLAWAVVMIGTIAVVWTLMGGISTVIWTDLMLFLVFVIGAISAFITICYNLDGGWNEFVEVGKEAGKFQFWDFSTAFTKPYTIWAAIIASTWGSLGIYGTDQLIAQRMFCCKSEKAARWAIITSTASQFVTLTVLMVGAGLYAYYRANPLQGGALELYQQNSDNIFPIFIITTLPVGMKGLIIAGIFAAAISSLDSIMAAFSQTLMSAFYLPMRQRKLAEQQAGTFNHGIDEEHEEARNVRVSRIMIFCSAILLCAMAFVVDYVRQYYDGILNLALALASYASGGLFAGFALAFLPIKIDGRGFAWSSILSVFTVFALVWHQPWAQKVCMTAAGIMLANWFLQFVVNKSERRTRQRILPSFVQTIILMAGLAMMISVCVYGHFGAKQNNSEEIFTILAGPWYSPLESFFALESELKNSEIIFTVLAWPWYSPIGSIVAFVWGYLLANRKNEASS